ncbi:hypothetical protein BT96DRAFT_1071647, partial [Gymnopus androsaceus JB14]
IYDAPLTTTFKRLKIFSLSSLALSCSFAPLIFIIESQLPFFARTCLAFMAVSTSGLSTAMIAWVTRPYVTTLRRIDPANNGGSKGIELVTAGWRLQPRILRIGELAQTFRCSSRQPLLPRYLGQRQSDRCAVRPAYSWYHRIWGKCSSGVFRVCKGVGGVVDKVEECDAASPNVDD